MQVIIPCGKLHSFWKSTWRPQQSPQCSYNCCPPVCFWSQTGPLASLLSHCILALTGNVKSEPGSKQKTVLIIKMEALIQTLVSLSVPFHPQIWNYSIWWKLILYFGMVIMCHFLWQLKNLIPYTMISLFNNLMKSA